MTVKDLQKRVIEFRDKRNWKQFHNPKDLALSLTLEAAEVLEKFQWKNNKEIKEYVEKNRNDVGEELADVFYWILLLSNDLKIDLVDAFERKMEENNLKYPVEKSKGNHKKYTEL